MSCGDDPFTYATFPLGVIEKRRRGLATFLLRRLLLMLLTLWLLSLIVFLAGQVLPGDPGRAILGPLAASSAVKSLDAQLGVNRPLFTRYLSWLGGILHGDMGMSYTYRSPVAPFIGAALVNSVKLAALAFVIVVPLGIAGGVIAAMRAGRLTDRIISVTGLTLATVPEFVSGIVLIVVFGVTFKLLPVTAAAGRSVSRAAVPAPDPAGDTADRRVVRLLRPDGAGGDDRRARVRLHPNGRAQGPAAAHRAHAARAAQLAPADHHRHRHADRLPHRRAGRGGDPLQLPGDRAAHLQGGPGEGLPHARGRGAHRRRRLRGGHAGG